MQRGREAKQLQELEAEWIASGMTRTRAQLLAAKG